jgi:hypothetical protein
LWKRTLAVQDGSDVYATARGRLRESFIKTRRSVIPLVSKIGQELPSLTVHDISHLDALWSVADILMGKEFSINPAEAYVLGMSFLLHDAATSSFAYPDGIKGLSETTEWKDIVAQRGLTSADLVRGEWGYQLTLFETLRSLHANQAARLPVQTWRDLDGKERFLIEDIQLRNHYGRIIGKIAAGHGRDSADVESEWAYGAPISPHSSLGLDSEADWSVDGLKIAMLIRCIDASHIDSQRAPDFEAALLAPAGESRNHWLFQNKLGALAINSKNELYWSASAFGVQQSDAWWRCFETCKMIDREIRSANRILTDHNRQLLKAIGVMGANDAEIFQRNVPVEGWHPVDFGFQVSQVGNVIEKFGGEKLYGENPYLALRELIQNSADAIRARRLHTLDPSRGKIEVKLRCEADGATWWLDVKDDGLGMSRFVLTDVLLDFGRSLWKDPSLREQWSGLSSKGFSAVGQFGIGFFSIFMLGDEVKVTSWRYGTGIEDQLTLHLRDRVRERPILINSEKIDRLSEYGTKISVRLNSGRSGLLRKVMIRQGGVSFPGLESLSRLVGYLAPTLDINLWVHDGDDAPVQVVASDDWRKIPALELLKRLALPVDDKTLARYAESLTDVIDDTNEIIGRVGMYAEGRFAIRSDTAMLTHRGIIVGKCSGMIGVLLGENSEDLARRRADPVASASAMEKWAIGQFEISSHLTPRLSEQLVSLGISEKTVIVGHLDGNQTSIADIIEIFKSEDIFTLNCLIADLDCPEHISQNDFDQFQIADDILDMTGCSPETRFDFGMQHWLRSILPETDELQYTLIDLLQNRLSGIFPEMYFEEGECEIGEIDGNSIEARCLIIKR